jgi:hypothetical protein
MQPHTLTEFSIALNCQDSLDKVIAMLPLVLARNGRIDRLTLKTFI